MRNNAIDRPNIVQWHHCLMLAAMILLSPFSHAFGQTGGGEKFSLSIGLFITDQDSKTQVDAQASIPDGTEVDLEGELGVDTSDSVFRLDGYYRFNQKHRIDFSWFDLSRTGSNLIQRDIRWNGTVFPIDTSVDSEFDLGIYKTAYTWSFLQRKNSYLGLTAGLYIADIKAMLAAPSIAATEAGGVTAPLPVIGLRGEHHFSEKWSLRASGEIFAFEYGDFDGSLYDLYLGLDYQLFDRMAVGLGFNSVGMNIGVTKSDLNGDLDWRYDGGLVFLKFDF